MLKIFKSQKCLFSGLFELLEWALIGLQNLKKKNSKFWLAKGSLQFRPHQEKPSKTMYSFTFLLINFLIVFIHISFFQKELTETKVCFFFSKRMNFKLNKFQILIIFVSSCMIRVNYQINFCCNSQMSQIIDTFGQATWVLFN